MAFGHCGGAVIPLGTSGWSGEQLHHVGPCVEGTQPGGTGKHPISPRAREPGPGSYAEEWVVKQQMARTGHWEKGALMESAGIIGINQGCPSPLVTLSCYVKGLSLT